MDFASILGTIDGILDIKKCSLESIPPLGKNYCSSYSGEVYSFKIGFENGIDYNIALFVPPDYPHALPVFFLVDRYMYGHLNHVNHIGVVCIYDAENILIDEKRPAQVLKDAVEMVKAVLSPHHQKNNDELLDEFEGYWKSLPGLMKTRVIFDLPVHDCFFKTKASIVGEKSREILCIGLQDFPVGYGLKDKYCNAQEYTAYYVPLDSFALPPHPASGLNVEYFNYLLEHVSEKNRLTAVSLLKKQKGSYKNIIVFSQPRPSGGRSVFGLETHMRDKANAILDSEKIKKLIPFGIARHDRKYLLERGGGTDDLKDRTVAIVGCGAVGCRIAELLALAGVGKLVLFDYDKLTTDNLYRHMLGAWYVNENKARSIAKELRYRLPHVQVEAKPMCARTDLGDIEPGWDLIIDATGDLHRMRRLNIAAHGRNGACPLVFTWLEPVGLGGHALLTKKGVPGCLECLFTDCGTRLFEAPRTAYLAPGQHYTKELGSCSGAFTPYSVVDATKTAIIATELSLKWLKKEQASIYRTWKGDDEEARCAELNTTQWYKHAKTDVLANAINDFVEETCPVCGKSSR